MRDEISDSHLQGFRRLREHGISGDDLRPWIARARAVTVETFLDQVRWVEAARAGWCANGHRNFAAGRPDPPSPSGPPSFTEWIRIRAEWNLRPDLLAWIACGWQISARGGIEPPPPGPVGSEIGEAGRVAAPGANPLGPSSVPNPLVPSLSEPATRTQRLFAPQSVARELTLALEAVRAIHGSALPDWWCLEVMMLHVRRDWARESNWARTRTEHYEIFARDGFRCTAPGCRSRRNLQAHHIAFRSQGGSDDPSNLTTLCAACHQFALHTAQALKVRGRAPHRLVWEMGRETGPDGRERPWRRFVGEFRREKMAQR
jgi:hypothetical protein